MPTRSDPWPPGTPCWVDISVPDVPAVVAFYEAVFGWKFVDTAAEFGHYQICRVDGHAAAAIGPRQDEKQPAAWTVYLASDNTDATANTITGNGGTLLAEPFDVPGNGRMCAALDPTGAAFGVWQAGSTIGAEISAEPGALTWADARLLDPDQRRAFYTKVFGYEYQPVPAAPEDYRTFGLGGDPLGGMGGMMGAPAGTSAHWVAYLAVTDTDAAIDAADAAGEPCWAHRTTPPSTGWRSSPTRRRGDLCRRRTGPRKATCGCARCDPAFRVRRTARRLSKIWCRPEPVGQIDLPVASLRGQPSLVNTG